METVSYIRIFNQVIDEFFVELIETFPEETSIKVNYTLFKTLIKVNVKKTCIEFMEKSSPFLEKILNRDEQFFLSKDKPGFLDSLNIEKIWTPGLSPVTKQAIWKYIQSFLAIGCKIVEMPMESQILINKIIKLK